MMLAVSMELWQRAGRHMYRRAETLLRHLATLDGRQDFAQTSPLSRAYFAEQKHDLLEKVSRPVERPPRP